MAIKTIGTLFALAFLTAGPGSVPAQSQPAGISAARIVPGDSLVLAGAEIFDQIVYLPVRVNGAGPFPFVLDTGAGPTSILDRSLADTLAVHAEPIAESGGAGEETVPVGAISAVDLALPGLTFEKIPALTIPLRRLDPHWGKRKDGLIAGDILSQFITCIDYERERIILRPVETAAQSATGERIPLQIFNNFLFVQAKVDLYGQEQPAEAFLMVDTGLRITVFNGPFAQQHRLAGQSPLTTAGMTGFGIGGVSQGVVGRVRAIQLGALRIDNPVVAFSLDKQGALADSSFSGILGADILSRCLVVLDYSRAEMILQPARRFADPYEFDMSGIRFVMEGDRFEKLSVFYVFEGSPAAEANIRPGDIVTAIDGRPSGAFTREALREHMQREGAQVRLDIIGDGIPRTATLRLRRMA